MRTAAVPYVSPGTAIDLKQTDHAEFVRRGMGGQAHTDDEIFGARDARRTGREGGVGKSYGRMPQRTDCESSA